MKNMIKMAAAMLRIAAIAVIGLGMAACNSDIFENDSSTNGRLTITGLNSYAGWKLGMVSLYDAYLPNGDELFFTVRNNPEYYGWGEAEVGGGDLYVWIAYESKGAGALKNYTGSDKNVRLTVCIMKNDGSIYSAIYNNAAVDFTDGKAVMAFADVLAGTWTGNNAQIAAEYGSFKLFSNGKELTRGEYSISPVDFENTEYTIYLYVREVNMSSDVTDRWVLYDSLTDEEKANMGSKSASGTIMGSSVNTFILHGGSTPSIFTKQP